jgi:thiamine biosynthesis protein ThiS
LPKPVEITLNGKAHAVSCGATVALLLADLGLGSSRVAVEKNGQVVPRAAHDATLLMPGDQVEVVAFVGGG